jgi:hypothetical protein
MRPGEIDDLVGIYEEDGSIKCRDCMKNGDWKGLPRESIISEDDVKDGKQLLYCDYCEEKL